MNSKLLMAPALGLILALSACGKPDTPSEASNSAQADAAMDSAGEDLSAGVDKMGDAASHAADGVAASGKELLKKGKAAAADAASNVSTSASKASSKLSE
jgi:hypothetical protein